MTMHSSILAWRIPWTEEPGGLQSMGSQSQTRLSDLTLLLYRFYMSIVLSYIKGLNVKDLGILGDSRINLFMGTEGQLCSEVPHITKREVS